MSVDAELGSIASTLDGLVDRVAALAADSEGHPTDDVSIALYDVERSLAAASRRLARAIRELERR